MLYLAAIARSVTIFTNGGKSLASPSLKIVIPMAGYGTRLRPHTWSRPKPLIRLADKMVIDHVLDSFPPCRI